MHKPASAILMLVSFHILEPGSMHRDNRCKLCAGCHRWTRLAHGLRLVDGLVACAPDDHVGVVTEAELDGTDREIMKQWKLGKSLEQNM